MLMLLAIACGPKFSVCPKEVPSAITVHHADYLGAIMSADAALEASFLFGSDVDGVFVLSSADVETLESRLPTVLEEASRDPARVATVRSTGHRQFLSAEIDSISKRLGEYRRQYFGVLKGERRFIYANFFPLPNSDSHDSFEDWRVSIVSVDDGGNNYWHIWFDIDSGQFSGFESNGYA
jgi:hypothetical protein